MSQLSCLVMSTLAQSQLSKCLNIEAIVAKKCMDKIKTDLKQVTRNDHPCSGHFRKSKCAKFVSGCAPTSVDFN